jgi:succinate dehydrogenase/fumarate reductase iron-sulfur protein
MPDITFHVQRNDPAAGLSEMQDFVVPVAGSLTVLEALFQIQEKQDPSLAFRYCCRSSICGSCAMYINGRYRLACQTNILHLDTDNVTVLPLPHVPVIRDLVWNMDDFFDKYEYIKPWLIHNSQTPETELLQSPRDRGIRATMPARSACRASTTSAACIAATPSRTVWRRAPRSSTLRRASSGSRRRRCGVACSGAASEGAPGEGPEPAPS